MGLGDNNQAFELLEKAYTEGNPMLGLLNVDSLLDPLGADRRFQDLVRRVNLLK